ncbi:hypothetical protein Pelo_6385 [Pelomyxa schiedti]|nr:hypothetical protein Pelo_6385 [Pelomyxa schiedti]
MSGGIVFWYEKLRFGKARSDLARAMSYKEWVVVAQKLDRLHNNDTWREISPQYGAALISHITSSLSTTTLREPILPTISSSREEHFSDNIFVSRYLKMLNTACKVNVGGVHSEQVYAACHYGTKQSYTVVYRPNSPVHQCLFPNQQKELFHNKESLTARNLASHLRFNDESYKIILERIWTEGHMCSETRWAAALQLFTKGNTFAEAYALTGHVLNITVVGGHCEPHLLNYLTAPSVVLYIPLFLRLLQCLLPSQPNGVMDFVPILFELLLFIRWQIGELWEITRAVNLMYAALWRWSYPMSMYLRERVRCAERNGHLGIYLWLWRGHGRGSGKVVLRSVELRYGTSMESFCSLCCGCILTINVIVPYLAGVIVLYTLYINSQMNLINYGEPGYISVDVKPLGT